MNKKRFFLFVFLGLIILLFGIIKVGIGGNKYLDEEYRVQETVINTFDLRDDNLKPLFMRDIFDDQMAKESPDIRGKVVDAIEQLTENNEMVKGDFKPIIFLKGNDKVLIGIKHQDNTITLHEFDITGEKPVKVDKQQKEAK
ncbi:MAG: hypothetical protein ACOY31_01680 [Bacillota bacterium]